MSEADRTAKPLLAPYAMAGLQLPNRVVMAPLTRSRATNADLAPSDLHVKYYGQRASAGLIITEGVWISRDAIGWHDVPGLFTDTQVRAWSAVTDSVHAAGGLIFAQLWHTGSSSHPDFFSGTPPLAPSEVDPGLRSHTPSGLQSTVVPRAMTRADIAATVADYAKAAANARRAGFDGVQLQAGFSYLISQFLNPATNLRTDEYGGSVINRARLLFEIIDAVGEHIDLNRVGVKAGPAWAEHGEFQSTIDTLDTSDYVIGRLNDYPLSHLLLMTAMADLSGRPLEKLQGRGMYEHYRPLFNGTLIANVGITPQAGNALIADGLVDLAAFGQPFIANPDLPARLAGGVALATRMLPRSTRVGRSATSTIRNIARPATRKVPFHGHAPIQQRPRIISAGPIFGDHFPDQAIWPINMDEFTSADDALIVVHQVIQAIGPDDLRSATPCGDWDVTALADHLIDTISRLGIAAGIAPTGTNAGSIAERLRQVTQAILADWRLLGLTGDVPFSGRTLPSPLALGILSLELLVHGWDFAVALQRPFHVSDSHAAYVLSLARQTLTAESRVTAGFGPPVAVSADASCLDQLVAFTGRDPRRLMCFERQVGR